MTRKLSSWLYADETQTVETLLAFLDWPEDHGDTVSAKAETLVEEIRKRRKAPGQLESFLQQYALDTEEGRALMTLAEALLRIPDKDTADALIRDKMAQGDWFKALSGSKDWTVKAAGFGLFAGKKTLDSAAGRLGAPVIREALLKAMRMMGQQFVLGRDIKEALKKSQPFEKKGYRFSYDMLGEGARTAEDAERYFNTYLNAITAIGRNVQDTQARRNGISVKLSALHPRYETAQADICVPALTEKLRALCETAAEYELSLTVDAEESERLALSLQIIENILPDPRFSDWDGFGLAVQAYQKRALPLIDHVAAMAENRKRRLELRLVKGAYWDSEIKRAQVLGLEEYPVFTRKANTDLSYLACAKKLLEKRGCIFPMIGTHNAHTAMAVLDMAGENGGDFEFQRLHGMGETLFDVLKDRYDPGICIYAPVGPHEDLLPYLVRRLLENGANSSFVHKILDPDEPAETIAADPVAKVRGYDEEIRHPRIPLPGDIYREEPAGPRKNSEGLDLDDAQMAERILSEIDKASGSYEAMPLIGGKTYKTGESKNMTGPADHSENIGRYWQGDEETVERAFQTAGAGFETWNETPAEDRAAALERFADLLEESRAELMALCMREGGKTLADARDEVREAVDFCRYYANRARVDFSVSGRPMSGPTGEQNTLHLSGRGVFVCISPWNFLLAIFTGQVAAALMAGNAVIAKPASNTPLIALRAVQLMHEAGIPENAVNLVPGSGALGGKMVAHPDTAGVAFTGSTEVAWQINRTLAKKDSAIVPLIAETGGQNAMIVDSSALPEQVIDDVILSAFGSAGQRCSALRILCVQEDIADKVIDMLSGAMQELRVGNPALLSTDVGPVIDEPARKALQAHRDYLDSFARLIAETPCASDLKEKGSFFPPCAYEIRDIGKLRGEVFGPVLHVVRYGRKDLDGLISALNGTGYGLTFGVHSRIGTFQQGLARRMRAGNVYVNRGMTGAVVGVQPFGGQGLSGTGPKAGGPHYLPRFATEKTISVDTTAAGGNASLVSIEE